MPKTNKQLDIWEQLINYTEQKPLNFKQLGRDYDINKLELEKITALQLKSKIGELEQRHSDQTEEQSKTWLQNQYRLFVWFFLAYMNFQEREPENFTQNDWNLISSYFRKYVNVCKYFCFSCKKIKSEPWSQQEDEFIMNNMKSNINKKWTTIGLQLYRITNGRRLRKPKAIRQRWLSHLNPDIKKFEWTLQQEYQLIQKVREFGKKWSKIAKILGNRSEHTVKNRYNKIILKFKRKNEGSLDLQSEDLLLNLIESQFLTKVRQQNSNKIIVKKQHIETEDVNENVLMLGNEFTKIQNDPIKDALIANSTTIFTPIIIVFGAFTMK